MLSTSSATWRAASARRLPSVTRRSRSRAAIRAARFTTVWATTTTRTNTSSSLRGEKRLLPLQDPRPNSDTRRVSRLHPSIAEAASPEGSCLCVRSVGCVVDDAEVEVDLRHVHALTDWVETGLDDLDTRLEGRGGLH